MSDEHVNRIAVEYSNLLSAIARDFHLTRDQAASIVARVTSWLEPGNDERRENTAKGGTE